MESSCLKLLPVSYNLWTHLSFIFCAGQFSSSSAETREATVGLVRVLSSQASDPEVCVNMLQHLINLLQGKGELIHIYVELKFSLIKCFISKQNIIITQASTDL